MSAVTLEVITMLPPSGRCGAPCLTTWNAPRTWTASTRAKTSLGYSTSGATAPLIPALLKSTSRRPWRSTPSAIARSTAASSVTSARALGDEEPRGDEPDPALATGDEDHLVVQARHGARRYRLAERRARGAVRR